MEFFDPPEAQKARENMVREQLQERGIRSVPVLQAMLNVPRHYFVPSEWQSHAYEDRALPIGFDQTISQPYMVAIMTELLEPFPGAKVLEIGTGSGYQAAILCALGADVTTVERIEPLSRRAQKALAALGFSPRMFVGDGSAELPEEEVFDRIIVTAAAPDVPPIYLERLAPGGILVLPVGDKSRQILRRIRRQNGDFHTEDLMYCIFVPLVGRYGFEPASEQNS